jgi:hypothetical protein
MKKERQSGVFYLVKCRNSEAQVRKYNYKDYGRKRLKQRDANFRWMRLMLLASAVVMLFQTGEAYFNLGLTRTQYNNNNQQIVGEEHARVRVCSSILSD